MLPIDLPHAQTYSASETCQILRISKRTLKKLIKTGRIKFIQLERNGKRYFTSSSIMDFIQSVSHEHFPTIDIQEKSESGFMKCLKGFLPKV